MQLIFFPFSCEIKEIERTKTCNEGMKRTVLFERKIFLRGRVITVTMTQGQCDHYTANRKENLGPNWICIILQMKLTTAN